MWCPSQRSLSSRFGASELFSGKQIEDGLLLSPLFTIFVPRRPPFDTPSRWAVIFPHALRGLAVLTPPFSRRFSFYRGGHGAFFSCPLSTAYQTIFFFRHLSEDAPTAGCCIKPRLSFTFARRVVFPLFLITHTFSAKPECFIAALFSPAVFHPSSNASTSFTLLCIISHTTSRPPQIARKDQAYGVSKIWAMIIEFLFWSAPFVRQKAVRSMAVCVAAQSMYPPLKLRRTACSCGIHLCWSASTCAYRDVD